MSVPLWIPGVSDAIEDVHAVAAAGSPTCPSSASPRCSATALAGRAAEAADNRAAAWLQFLRGRLRRGWRCCPVLVFGAGVDALEVPTYLLATVLLLTLIFLLFALVGAALGDGPGDATRAAPPAGGTALVRRVRGEVRQG